MASNPRSKLHCCLVILILFILAFLSLPLLLIYVANDTYEADMRLQAECPTQNATKSATTNDGQPVQCPASWFPCAVCPQMCIKQSKQCDGIYDCPDRSDEGSCWDGTGILGSMYQKIYDSGGIRVVGSSSSSSSSSLSLSAATATSNINNSKFAKPDSCDVVDFENNQCACNMSDPKVIICDHFGLERIPNDLLSSVFKIRMSNNSINSVNGVKWPQSLTALALLQNKVTAIRARAFLDAPNLSKLYLSQNLISEISVDAFESLNGLTTLHLDSNLLWTFDTLALKHTPAIARLYLSENQIDLPLETNFSIAPNLKELLLDHNRISIIKRHWFAQMPQLSWLSLTNNQIESIEPNSFDGNYDLMELNLSFNRIKVIDQRIFAHRLNIQRLYLSGNPIDTLPVGAFREVLELKSLNLTQIEFKSLESDTFTYLAHLDYIYFEKFRYCHYVPKVRVCRPITDGLSSKEQLLAFSILKYAVWIVALVCTLGNVFVFVWRSVSPHEDQTLSFFIKNLSIADLMMGVYLCTIGWQDWKFKQKFRENAIEWMSSWECTAIGFLAILSSELSVFILTIITYERHRAIISNNLFEERERHRRAYAFVILAWLCSFFIATYPLLRSQYYAAATNGLCLPLHIDKPYTSGWEYSAFIYLGINFFAVMVIIGLYAHMYMIIIDGHQTSKPALFKAEKREDAILAIRFFFIVLTDCLCWIPIVVIKLMALLEFNISASIYGWLVVFIIPINSALNPIVYTLAAPTTLRCAICHTFGRMCNQIDNLIGAASALYPRKRSSGASSSGVVGGGGGGTGSGCKLDNPLRQRQGRNKTGSNSTTTWDTTFDTSIISVSGVATGPLTNESKGSLDCGVVGGGDGIAAAATVAGVTTTNNISSDISSTSKESSFSASSNSSPSVISNPGSIFVHPLELSQIVNDKNNSSSNNSSCSRTPQHTVAAAAGARTCVRPFDCIASLEHNSSLKHKILVSTDDKQPRTRGDNLIVVRDEGDVDGGIANHDDDYDDVTSKNNDGVIQIITKKRFMSLFSQHKKATQDKIVK